MGILLDLEVYNSLDVSYGRLTLTVLNIVSASDFNGMMRFLTTAINENVY